MADNNISKDVEKQDGQPSVTPASDASQVFLSIEQYRVLVGIPQDQARPLSTTSNSGLPKLNGNTIQPISPHNLIRSSTIESGTRTMPRILIVSGLLKRPGRAQRNQANHGCDEANEYPTSLYYALKQEETDQWSQYHLYNFITYTCLVSQLVIASALIVLGAIPNANDNSEHRIAIAILGAITGLLTGVLSLLKGQGLPMRFLQYASRLREVRTNIEFKDRILRSGAAPVTYRDVLDILDQYEAVLEERDMNRPDQWATQTGKNPQKSSLH